MFSVRSEPGVRCLMVQMGRIEECDENIHVEQRNHTTFQPSSRSRLTISEVTSEARFRAGRTGTPFLLRGT